MANEILISFIVAISSVTIGVLLAAACLSIGAFTYCAAATACEKIKKIF